MTCRVQLNIRASAKTLWLLLTDAKGYPQWNPTIERIEGHIAEGERLRLHVPGTKRTFSPRVSSIVPARRMVWGDGIRFVFKGVRTFTLEPCSDGSTNFVMEENFSGLVFAAVKGVMPDFRPIFEAFALGLGREAEARIPERELDGMP